MSYKMTNLVNKDIIKYQCKSVSTDPFWRLMYTIIIVFFSSEYIYPSVLQLEDNFAEVEKMESLPPSSYASTAIVVVCVLIGDMARGILFPSLWLLVQSLSGSKVYQGFAVSAFSAGRILSSPLFGWLSEKYGYRNVLITCNAIVFFGCYMYSLSKTVNGVILGQFIIGIGAGSLGVTRSYVAEKTHRTERTLYMAYMT